MILNINLKTLSHLHKQILVWEEEEKEDKRKEKEDKRKEKKQKENLTKENINYKSKTKYNPIFLNKIDLIIIHI